MVWLFKFCVVDLNRIRIEVIEVLCASSFALVVPHGRLSIFDSYPLEKFPIKIMVRDLDQSTLDRRKVLMENCVALRPRPPGFDANRKLPVGWGVKKTVEEEVLSRGYDRIRPGVILTPSHVSMKPAKMMGTKMVTTEKSFSDIDLKLKVRLVVYGKLYLPIPRECGGGEKEEKKEEETSHGTNPP